MIDSADKHDQVISRTAVEQKDLEIADKQGIKKSFLPVYLSKNRYLLAVSIFAVIGVVGGYAYYFFVGCKSGSCGITSNPTMSILWGGAVGYLLHDLFVKRK